MDGERIVQVRGLLCGGGSLHSDRKLTHTVGSPVRTSYAPSTTPRTYVTNAAIPVVGFVLLLIIMYVVKSVIMFALLNESCVHEVAHRPDPKLRFASFL